MNTAEHTPEQKRALGVVLAFAEAIRTATATSSLNGVPSGHLYQLSAAQAGFSLERYQSIIDILKNTGLVVEKNHLLSWVGPVGSLNK